MCVLVNEGNHNVACSQRGQPAILDSRQGSWTFIIRLLSVGRPTVYKVTDHRMAWNKVVFHWYQKVLVLHQEVRIRYTPLYEYTGKTRTSDSLFVGTLCINDDLAMLLKPSSALQTIDKYIPKGGHWREYSAFLAQFRQLIKVEENGE